jgi:enoyl-CoA hydratase/carnithine racemase
MTVVLTEDRAAVRIVTMNRPEARNAFDGDLIVELYAALVEADESQSCAPWC